MRRMCATCEGVGFVVTSDGARLIEFLNRHEHRLRLREETRNLDRWCDQLSQRIDTLEGT